MPMKNVKEAANFIWSIADLLRGEYKQSDYGKVILPLTILRRLDCVLEPSREAVRDEFQRLQDLGLDNVDRPLNRVSGHKFHNTSPYNFELLCEEPDKIAANLREYIRRFSSNAREIIEKFDFDQHISRLDDAKLLYMVIERFKDVDLGPDAVGNIQMGYMFEELIRKFAELSNETAGEHFTPREVIRLMVQLLFAHDQKLLEQPGTIRKIFDCCAGTGGMLSVAEEYLQEVNPQASLISMGQELNPESYAICKSDMLIKGQEAGNIRNGNSLSQDQFAGEEFDYLITNPPFGVKWKKIQPAIKKEHEQLGGNGRFKAGIPSVSDGSLLFLLHLISKMKNKGPSRIAIVFNGSPLFSGSPSSKKNESSIRQWIIERDLLETIVALPNQLFYNTGIHTYVWILTNQKEEERRGKVQLINAVDFYQKMAKSLGDKRNELNEDHINEILRLYREFEEGTYVKIFPNAHFGYRKVTVERPLMKNGKVVRDRQGRPKPDSKLRDTELIPLLEDVDEYMAREVDPHVEDAWIDDSKTKIGYEINFTKYFYEYQALRPLDEIRADIEALEAESDALMQEVFA